MHEATQRTESARKQAKHREGVAHQLKAIRAEIQDLRSDVHEVLAAKMILKSLVKSESDYAD